MAPFDLNLRHLRALDAIVQCRRMRVAAEAVSLSQPALTQGLARLERQLGVLLFERRPDGVVPTSAGLTMAARAVRAFDLLGQASRRASRGGTRIFSRAEHLMTATQLRALTALADHGSFVAAALATDLSEPSLHRAVRDLEQTVGVALVERRGRGVQLTDAGRHLARGARLAAAEIVAGIVDLSHPGRDGDGRPRGRIAIGAMPLARARILPAAVAAFQRGGPAAAIDIVEGSWRDLIEPLRDGLIDLTIGALRDGVPAGFVQRPLFQDRLVVVGRVGHPLVGSAPDAAALSGYPWMVASPGSPLRHQWDLLFAGRDPPAPIACGSVMVIRGILIETDMLTLLSPDQVAAEIAGGVLAIVCEPLPALIRTIGTTVRPGWQPTAAQARFLRLLDLAASHHASGNQIGVPSIGMERIAPPD
ncbi:LysR family transcriptional regulator [Sphingomonas bacterium]|uniref:LysR family transcriptional regulator n=1 Tax=Sphingomonas bacterium TaxID=1895847 RepID=UPI0020C6C5A2|nr:LysR family transcriptional regulator [Sphingomonas bacterium]